MSNTAPLHCQYAIQQLSCYCFPSSKNWNVLHDVCQPNFPFFQPTYSPLELGHVSNIKRGSKKTPIDWPTDFLEVLGVPLASETLSLSVIGPPIVLCFLTTLLNTPGFINWNYFRVTQSRSRKFSPSGQLTLGNSPSSYTLTLHRKNKDQSITITFSLNVLNRLFHHLCDRNHHHSSILDSKSKKSIALGSCHKSNGMVFYCPHIHHQPTNAFFRLVTWQKICI